MRTNSLAFLLLFLLATAAVGFVHVQNCEAGESNAHDLYEKGENFYLGREGPKNYLEAARCFFEAAYHGDYRAQYRIGKMHLKGQGISKNLVQAYVWFSLAKANIPAVCNSSRKDSERISEKIEAGILALKIAYRLHWLENHLEPEDIVQAQQKAAVVWRNRSSQ